MSEIVPAAHVAARVIPAIGRTDFPERLLSVFHDLAGCDLCSAFLWESQRPPRLLFATGTHPGIPGFALEASRAYTRMYWRHDALVLRRIRDFGNSSLLLTNAADIRDPEYRRHCYQGAGISERMTLFDTGTPTLSVSGYRTTSRGTSNLAIARWIEAAGPILVASLRRHNELTERASRTEAAPSRTHLFQRVRDLGLSAREAEVAVGLATGLRQSDIAMRSGLTLNSIVTYRRRAYQKLKVGDRAELRAMCERLISPEES